MKIYNYRKVIAMRIEEKMKINIEIECKIIIEMIEEEMIDIEKIFRVGIIMIEEDIVETDIIIIEIKEETEKKGKAKMLSTMKEYRKIKKKSQIFKKKSLKINNLAHHINLLLKRKLKVRSKISRREINRILISKSKEEDSKKEEEVLYCNYFLFYIKFILFN